VWSTSDARTESECAVVDINVCRAYNEVVRDSWEAPEDLVSVWAGESDWLIFAPDGSGWATHRVAGALDLAESSPPMRYIRFARRTHDAAFVAREVSVSFFPGQGTQAMREIPLGRLEAAANRPEVRERLTAAIPVNDNVTVPLPDTALSSEGWPWWAYEPPRPPRAPRLRIKGAHDRRKPEDFYRRVAECFAFLTTTSPNPAEKLATAQVPEVPVTTVHGWVKEARRRGLLAPGERSREG
jgi:hypothetical protein